MSGFFDDVNDSLFDVDEMYDKGYQKGIGRGGLFGGLGHKVALNRDSFALGLSDGKRDLRAETELTLEDEEELQAED